MSTTKLYQDNVYQQKLDTTVTAVTPFGITLSETIFFPTGGGQSCDIGKINSNSIFEVYEKSNEIFHKTDGTFQVGDKVHCTINWEHRFDNMQRHCGEHILSGIFHREYGGVNRGFHMGENYMTIDISLEDDPTFNVLTMEMALNVERLTNEVIWKNLPVTTRRFNSIEEAKGLPLRKALSIEKDISIVSIGDERNPSDCVACCGTHPSTSGQVGLVKIYKVEKNKNMFRVYFEAGQRALLDYDYKHDLILKLSAKFSSGADDMLKKVNAKEEKNEQIIYNYNLLRKSVVSQRSREILENKNFFKTYEYDDITVDDALHIGKQVQNNIQGILLLTIPKEKTILLFSNGQPDCNLLVKDISPIYGGKGGGQKTSARCILKKTSNLPVFIDAVRKHLK